MHTFFICICYLLVTLITNAQTPDENNVYMSYEEFLHDAPSRTAQFTLKQRTKKDLFWTGGILNYRLKNIYPDVMSDLIKKYAWGIKADGKNFINGYLYCGVGGFNEILEKGYYTYFVGAPAQRKEWQVKTGLIKEGDKRIDACCKVGYVILPSGEVRILNPEYLATLIADNEELSARLQTDSLKMEQVPEMFEFLKEYNKTK